jgi:hypothetical protein
MKQLREKFLPIVADSMVEDTEVKEIDNFGAYVNLMRK